MNEWPVVIYKDFDNKNNFNFRVCNGISDVVLFGVFAKVDTMKIKDWQIIERDYKIKDMELEYPGLKNPRIDIEYKQMQKELKYYYHKNLNTKGEEQ